jgi:hypothetical protein
VEAVPSWRRATVIVSKPTDPGAWVGIAGSLDAGELLQATVAPAQLVAELERLRKLWHPVAVAYSGTTAAAPHIKAWAEAADVKDVPLGQTDVRRASELFRSELVGGRLTHADDPLLAEQVRRARPAGAIESGSWYLSVKESVGEVDAIRAAAWAAWATIAPEEPVLGPQLF